MMKIERTFQLFLMCVLVLVVGRVDASITHVRIIEDNRVYGDGFTASDVYFMNVSTWNDNAGDSVEYLGPPFDERETLDSVPIWTAIWPDEDHYLNVKGYPSGPPPGFDWVGTYEFYVNENLETTRNIGDSDFQVVAPVGNPTITGGVHPIISWDAVPNVDDYQVLILGLDSEGNPDFTDLRDWVPGFSDKPHYDYKYEDNAFEGNETLAVRIQANAGNTGDLFHRSTYHLKHNPVPIPGAIWLLGSGLVGLVGIRRKFSR